MHRKHRELFSIFSNQTDGVFISHLNVAKNANTAWITKFANVYQNFLAKYGGAMGNIHHLFSGVP